MLSIALPTGVEDGWLEKFADGLLETQKLYDCELVGGDTVSTNGPLVISITLLGDVERGQMVRRKGAMAGDIIFVSGTIGDAALGLLLRLADDRLAGLDLSKARKDLLLDSYLHPQPRMVLAPLLVRYASAAMDISDGLAGDLAKLCAASQVGGRIEALRVPLSDAASSALAQVPELMEIILTGGDDYQVLATVPADKADIFERKAQTATRVGKVVALGEGVKILDGHGKPLDLAHGAFDHFADIKDQ